jgi:hypothetical protein
MMMSRARICGVVFGVASVLICGVGLANAGGSDLPAVLNPNTLRTSTFLDNQFGPTGCTFTFYFGYYAGGYSRITPVTPGCSVSTRTHTPGTKPPGSWGYSSTPGVWASSSTPGVQQTWSEFYVEAPNGVILIFQYTRYGVLTLNYICYALGEC